MPARICTWKLLLIKMPRINGLSRLGSRLNGKQNYPFMNASKKDWTVFDLPMGSIKKIKRFTTMLR